MVERYRLGARINHWTTAIAMVLLVLSGLGDVSSVAVFPFDYFRGGQNTRTLHPWIGIILSVSFLVLLSQFWRAQSLEPRGPQLGRPYRDFVGGHEEKVSGSGQIQRRQKFVFWAMAL